MNAHHLPSFWRNRRRGTRFAITALVRWCRNEAHIRWASNRRMLSVSDDPVTVTELAQRLGITVKALRDIENALPVPRNRRRPYQWDRDTIELWLNELPRG